MTYIPPHIQQAYPGLSPVTQALIGAITPAGPPPSPPSATTYGAIAIDPLFGQFGWSWCCPNATDAEQRARSSAGPRSTSLVTGNHTVLALAKGDNGAYGYATGRDRAAAAAGALNYCSQHGRNGALVLIFHTSSGLNLA